MLLDNEINSTNSTLKVHEWLSKYIEQGDLDVVTGYFTIGALAFLAKITKNNIKRFRFVLGDIVSIDDKLNALDLLNENLGIDNMLKLNRLAKEAVEFLELQKVECKTLEPNFCHAKVYLKTADVQDALNYFILGSSNLTEAGIGLKTASNVELNLAETGNNNQYKELIKWFDALWIKPQAHLTKSIIDSKGKVIKKVFKQYLIDEIAKIFKIYTPEQIYYKILFELFNKQNDSADVERQLIKLEDTKIYSRLYDFQIGGVKSIIRMINKYNGAILADAVGLGKTWTALAVMKSFQMKGDEVILLCPKKLEQNWTQYLKRNNSIFEEDKFDYVIRFHTDLREGGLHSGTINEDFFTNDKPKLIVIDESHNLRNDKANRYKYLVEEILQKSKGDVKVLLLSATPINNSFTDIRNQFKLISLGRNNGFAETLGINNLEFTFREVQKVFNIWSKVENPKLSEFHASIKESDFFNLTDHLLVARTRKTIKANFNNNLNFPKHIKPINIFKTPMHFGDVENFAELMENLDLNLWAYQPSYFIISKEERKKLEAEKKAKKKKGEKGEKDAILKDDIQREHFLVKMMMILLLKRLESSWYSFYLTLKKVYDHHERALIKVKEYETLKNDAQIDIESEIDELNEENESDILDSILFGKKNPISIRQIDDAGNLDDFKSRIKKDKRSLKYVIDCVETLEKQIIPETTPASHDIKLQELLKIILKKQECTNKKIVIFTAYKDTALYLFNQFKKRGFVDFAMVAGDENKVWDESHGINKHEKILERFAPFTKLYLEKNWANFENSTDAIEPLEKFEEWKTWIKDSNTLTQIKLEKGIDIIIATDVLSEGQNLQDANMVINYDIHWNPVRVIQRVGRIDRIGSPNEAIQTINFWPAKDIDGYINLKQRVEKRMALMKLSGSEVIETFTDEFDEIAESEKLEDQQNANMLRQMESSLEDIDGEKSLGFDDFSFDNYRQLLQNMLNEKQKEFENMPNGVFSGFKLPATNEMQPGLIALLGYPAQVKYKPDHKYLSHELIYIDNNGNQISNNQKIILEQLNKYYLEPTYVDAKIMSGDTATIEALATALRNWIDNQVKRTSTDANGEVKEVVSRAGLAVINKLKNSPKAAIEKMKTEGNISEKYNFDNFDLITWLILS